MDVNSGAGQREMNRLDKLFYCTRPYPFVDRIVRIYVAVVLLFQVMFQISPIMTFFTGTPLYSVQTYLGLLGGMLLLVDVFTTKNIWRGSNCLLLYGILVLAALASLRAIEYGIKENLFKICWATIQFSLVYSLAHRMDRKELRRYGTVLYVILVGIWLWACCVSLKQYLNQIGYWELVNPLAKDGSYNRQGFFDNRLFGIFHTLNHAAYISLIFAIIGTFLCFGSNGIFPKIFAVVSDLILLSHILLSGSRSAFVSLLACIFCSFWMLLYTGIKTKGVKKWGVPLVIALVICGVAGFGLKVSQSILGVIPHYYSQYLEESQETLPSEETDPTITETEKDTQPESSEETDPTITETEKDTQPEPSEETDPTITETEKDTQPEPSEETDPTITETEKDTQPEFSTEPTKAELETKPQEDLLQRDYLENDQSNGRFSIWRDYISLYREVGVIGLSPGYYMDYVRDHHPELYIVEYIRLYYPAKYQSGFIYHVHSGYLMVYVSAGLGGLLLLVAFVVLCMVRVFRKIWTSPMLSGTFICSFVLVLVVAISAVFDEGIFFQNNPQTTVFWLSLGILMKEACKKNDKNCEVLEIE